MILILFFFLLGFLISKCIFKNNIEGFDLFDPRCLDPRFIQTVGLLRDTGATVPDLSKPDTCYMTESHLDIFGTELGMTREEVLQCPQCTNYLELNIPNIEETTNNYINTYKEKGRDMLCNQLPENILREKCIPDDVKDTGVAICEEVFDRAIEETTNACNSETYNEIKQSMVDSFQMLINTLNQIDAVLLPLRDILTTSDFPKDGSDVSIALRRELYQSAIDQSDFRNIQLPDSHVTATQIDDGITTYNSVVTEVKEDLPIMVEDTGHARDGIQDMWDFLNDNESFVPDFVFEGGDNNIFVKSIHTLNQVETTLGSINDAVTNINPIDEQTRSEIEGRVVQAHAILYIAHDIIINSITIIQNIQDFFTMIDEDICGEQSQQMRNVKQSICDTITPNIDSINAECCDRIKNELQQVCGDSMNQFTCPQKSDLQNPLESQVFNNIYDRYNNNYSIVSQNIVNTVNTIKDEIGFNMPNNGIPPSTNDDQGEGGE